MERIMPQVEQVEEPVPDWTPDPEYQDWADEQVAEHYERVAREHERRRVIAAAAETSEQAMATYRAAKGIHDGMPWRQPTGYLDAVQPGETRLWEGGLYENTSGAPLLQSPGDAPEAWTVVPPVEETTEPEPVEEPAPEPEPEPEPGPEPGAGAA